MFIASCLFKRKTQCDVQSNDYEKGLYIGASDNNERSSILDSNYSVVPWEDISDWKETLAFNLNIGVDI